MLTRSFFCSLQGGVVDPTATWGRALQLEESNVDLICELLFYSDCVPACLKGLYRMLNKSSASRSHQYTVSGSRQSFRFSYYYRVPWNAVSVSTGSADIAMYLSNRFGSATALKHLSRAPNRFLASANVLSVVVADKTAPGLRCIGLDSLRPFSTLQTLSISDVVVTDWNFLVACENCLASLTLTRCRRTRGLEEARDFSADIFLFESDPLGICLLKLRKLESLRLLRHLDEFESITDTLPRLKLKNLHIARPVQRMPVRIELPLDCPLSVTLAELSLERMDLETIHCVGLCAALQSLRVVRSRMPSAHWNHIIMRAPFLRTISLTASIHGASTECEDYLTLRKTLFESSAEVNVRVWE
jgi:hypothetical protein